MMAKYASGKLFRNKVAVAAIIGVAVIFILLVLTQPAEKPAEILPTQPSCGDGACNGSENCSSCPGDCGSCPAIPAINNSQWLPGQSCNYFNGSQDLSPLGAAYQYAIENQAPEACDCIRDETIKGTCWSTALNAKYYAQAASQLDERICDQISDSEMVKACKSLVASGVEYIGGSDQESLALIYLNNNNFDKALPLFEQMLSEDPQDRVALRSLALIYANYAWSGNASANAEKALGYVNRSLQIANNTFGQSDAYNIMGFAYEASGQPAMAVESYTKAINLTPSFTTSYVGRGHAYELTGALDAALADYRAAAEIDTGKNNLRIYVRLCRLLSSNDAAWQEAVSNCQIVIDSDKSDSDSKMGAYLMMGAMYSRKGYYDTALSNLKNAATYAPNDAGIYAGMAEAYIGLGDYANAKASAEKAASLAPTRAIAYYYLSYSMFKQGAGTSAAAEKAIYGLSLVDADQTLIGVAKYSMKNMFYSLLVEVYKAAGDTANEQKYAGMMS